MKGLMSRLGWLGLLGLGWLFANSEARAWERPPVKVNTVFQFRVEVHCGPEAIRPAAPWYTYFPADPRLMPSPQLSPYPPWPAQFPPAGPPSDALKDAQRQVRDSIESPGPLLTPWSPSPTGRIFSPWIRPHERARLLVSESLVWGREPARKLASFLLMGRLPFKAEISRSITASAMPIRWAQ